MAIKMKAIIMPCFLNGVHIFSASEVSLSINFGDRLFDSHNLAGESTLQEISAFLPDFQVVIQPFNPFPDVCSNAIGVSYWVVADFYELALFPFDVFFQLNFFRHLHL